jgi:hypothetical protein
MPENETGLEASGVSRDEQGNEYRIEVDSDRTIQIHAPKLYLDFDLLGRDDYSCVEDFRNFLANPWTESVNVGFMDGNPVELVHDNEFADRFWLKLRLGRISFEISGASRDALLDCLRQVEEDLA